MSLQKAIEAVTRLADQGAVEKYAITGAIAALNYIQPTLTEDLDVLISIPDFGRRPSGLILLAPVEEAFAKMGYTERTGAGLMVEGWPVQFLPVASELDQEALEQAIEIDIASEGHAPVKARSVRAEHLVAIAVKLGRLKDLARVQAFIEQRAVDLQALRKVLVAHHLEHEWRKFCEKADIEDPLKLA
jgi:hypothetical protein